jgi:antitoxin component of MazEF toxin-antitoxin module
MQKGGRSMSRQKITTIDNVPALILPLELIEQIGIEIGDEVDLAVVDNTLVLRSLADLDRANKIAEITQSLIERRRVVYERLAEGAS